MVRVLLRLRETFYYYQQMLERNIQLTMIYMASRSLLHYPGPEDLGYDNI